MKNINKIWGIALVAFMLMVSAPHKTMAQEGDYISDQEFYDELQPYGTWVYDEQFGNVWVPDVEEDFRPYATNGYWAVTDYGNTWVSGYPWGWATFHYGRWHFDDYYGWEWVPGNEWAPAWVSWRNGGGYYGWAPMEPGVTFDASFSNDYSVPDDYWVFAPYAYINYTNVYNYYAPRTRVVYIIRQSNWLRNRYRYNNHVYAGGPRRDEIQRYTNRPVRVYKISNASRPSRVTINNTTINIYRPIVKQNANARPARVIDGNAYKQQNPSQRIGTGNRQTGTNYNAANAAKLARAARAANPDEKVVQVNKPGNGDANTATRPARPGNVTRNNQAAQTNTPAANSDVQQNRQQQQEQIKQTRIQQNQQQQEEQKQQRQQQNQQAQEEQKEQRQQQLQQTRLQQQEQQRQLREQQQQQLKKAREQQSQQQQEQLRQQQEQAREQQRQQQQQARQQQQEQARQQQQEQQRVQQQARQEQQRQAREQQRKRQANP